MSSLKFHKLGWALAFCLCLVFAVSSGAKADSPFLGLQIQELSPKIVSALGIDVEQGLLVRDIAYPGPVSASELLRGDIILKVDGQKTPTIESVVKLMGTFQPGQTVSFEVFRLGRVIEFDVKIGKKPSNWAVERNNFATIPALGLTFAAITPKVRERFNLDWNARGIVISLLDESKAAGLDLNQGDVIIQVNQRPVWDPAHIVSYVKKAQSQNKDMVLLLVHGMGGYRYALMPVPKI